MPARQSRRSAAASRSSAAVKAEEQHDKEVAVDAFGQEEHTPQTMLEEKASMSPEQQRLSLAPKDAQTPPAMPMDAPLNSKFILVSDHGQTCLVPLARAGHCRKLPMHSIHAPPSTLSAAAESGTSTPVDAKKRLVRIAARRGRGRPRKAGSQSRFDSVEEDYEDDMPDEHDAIEQLDEGTPAGDAEGEEMADAADADDAAPPSMDMRVVVEGKEFLLKNDELQIEIDEAGEKKIDPKGNLLGGREFVFPVFQSDQRPDPEVWYALSIDAAKSAGGRDSFFFYRKNPLLIKLSCTDREKVWLIEHGRLPAHLRARNVTMLAVRNVYKLYGSKIIKDGKQVTDDYYETYARNAGRVEGNAADVADDEPAIQQHQAPQARAAERKQREAERERDRARRRADAYTHASTDFNGNPWLTTFGDAGEAPFERAKAWATRRANSQRQVLHEENWMYEMAQSVRGMNHELLAGRRERLRAFGRPYESIEGVVDEDQVGSTSSDTRLLAVGTGSSSSKKRLSGVSNLPIGVYEPLTNLPYFPKTTQSSWATFERVYEQPIVTKPAVQGAKREADLNNDTHLPVSKKHAPVLGGSKVGAQAWGVASMEQRVQLPRPSVGTDVCIPAAASLKEMDM